MCHHIRTADHERVVELAAEWEERLREEEEAEGDEDEGAGERVAAPADD